MTQILLLPDSYDAKYLNYDRVFPLIDNRLQGLIVQAQTQPRVFLNSNIPVEHLPDAVALDRLQDFITKFQLDLTFKDLNFISNLNTANRIDICLGCTQYIDSLYMRYGPNGIQTLENEYTYHRRLNPLLEHKTLDTLESGKPLIISQPFFYGVTHKNMDLLLDRCLELKIPVHVDGAWITACKNITFNFNHPAIVSVAVSMSKGYGLSGWNRIGLRWTKEDMVDAITVMNDFVQIPSQNVAVGLYFLKTVQPNHLWLTHEKNYNKICNDFDLTPTDSIHLAMHDGSPVGTEALLRYLENNV
jgi:hypothetical protein